jgi:hypothetical protein
MDESGVDIEQQGIVYTAILFLANPRLKFNVTAKTQNLQSIYNCADTLVLTITILSKVL